MKGNDLGDGRFGSRIAFAKDGTLFITCGDRDRPDGGQNPNDHFGKVIRVNDDGTVPKDNPFVGRAGYRPEIYTLGQRNQQGLAFNPVNGELWASEQGPERRRRDQRHQAGPQLRLAHRQLRTPVRRAEPVGDALEGRDGTAHRLLGAVHRDVRA